MPHEINSGNEIVSPLERRQEALAMMAGAMGTRSEFLKVAVKALAHGLNCMLVAVGEANEDRTKVLLLELLRNGEFVEPYTYDLVGTPCEEIYTAEGGDIHVSHCDGLCELFPLDTALVRIGAEGYRAEAFLDANGQRIGHVFIIDNKPIDDNSDEIAFFRLVSQRIGAEINRWRAEAALHESERQQRDLLNNTSSVIYIKALDGQYLFINQRYEELFHVTNEEIRGKTDYDLFPSEMADAFKANDLMALEATEPLELEEYVPQDDGEHTYISVKFSLTDLSGKSYAVCGISTDITERKRAEEELVEREKSLSETRVILENAIQSFSDGFALFDADDCFVLANEYYLTEHQVVRDIQVPGVKFELIVRKLAEVGFYGNSPAETEDWINKRLALFKSGTSFEYQMDDGRWYQVNQYKTAEGGTALVRVDISKLKEAEASRIQAEESLRKAQRMEAVGQLTGGIAHDFNNLMAVMMGNAEILADAIGDDADSRRSIDAIIKSVEKGSSLTSRLLAFSRQQTLSPVAVNVTKLISGLEDMFRRTLGATIELKVDASDDLWQATMDPHQFESAILNLAINARDAMPNGGMLVIETANMTFDPDYAKLLEDVAPGDYVEVAVTDTGDGMSADVLGKVFEPFFTTKEVGKGTGLGLSMVYGFCLQSNGHVTVYSEVGQGTTVRLYLPRAPASSDHDHSEEKAPDPANGSERILVVEDDEGVREVSVAMLRSQGYYVVEVTNGEEAMEQLTGNQPFDLLFTDIILPGAMNGVQIAEKAKKLRPQIKVLFTTGYAENAVVHNGRLDAGATMVNKPYRRNELLEKVRIELDDIKKNK